MREIVKDIQERMLKEQFIPDHVFLYIAKGAISFFDGSRHYTLQEGKCCIVRKNRLLKFILAESANGFEPVLFCFDEPFLRQFHEKHHITPAPFNTDDAVVYIKKTDWISDFIHSLRPYYKGVMQLDEAFEDLKYEELLILLLKNQPELQDLLFDFGIPEKINLEAFMNRNFTFNVSVEKLAYLTGRSLSAFKRDFSKTFNETPGRWLLQKRLKEAYFLIARQQKTPSEIYLDLGFETLSHFSFAFKKQFGCTPTELGKQKSKLID